MPEVLGKYPDRLLIGFRLALVGELRLDRGFQQAFERIVDSCSHLLGNLSTTFYETPVQAIQTRFCVGRDTYTKDTFRLSPSESQ